MPRHCRSATLSSLAHSIANRKASSAATTFRYGPVPSLIFTHDRLPRLLERFKLFTLFYHLSDLRSREDLVKAIIDNLDYTTCAPCHLPPFYFES